ncbi:PEP/pyruvate-binding domain-containing protein [Kribbella monticola]|uniref:PEP/pyruvate-binding domain-containing protein n=1 Tax=Kribbella monticola TaxID=2185285 RepID=UPI000DD4712A|nr:PEP/pyruvate-binding domain-containing protein [Kribbella monticola]
MPTHHCPSKAATLARLAKAGFPVPPAFVVPIDTYRSFVAHLDLPTALAERGPTELRRLIESQPLPSRLLTELTHALHALGDLPVAVRSSATTEDTPHASAAGQHDSHLAVQGAHAVATKLLATWSSLWTARATSYRRTAHPPAVSTADAANADGGISALDAAVSPGTAGVDPALAVMIQRHVDADVAGVLFTGSTKGRSGAGDVAVIDASWGLGESVVQGLVTPDEFVVGADGVLEVRLGDKQTRIDRCSDGTVTRGVPDEDRERACLTDDQVTRLWKLGQQVAEHLGAPQDIEFAIENDHIWLLQSRPITADLVLRSSEADAGERELVLRGTAGSPGVVRGPARVVKGPGDFEKVAEGDILVCPFTDPAWTVLFGVVAGVVTEAGGRLSHAAIVARERRIPAVLGISSLHSNVRDGQLLTIDGSVGTVRVHPSPNPRVS